MSRRSFLWSGTGLLSALATSGVGTTAVAREAPDSTGRLRLLFQRKLFTLPVDSFFLAEFEPGRGEFAVVRDVPAAEALALARRVEFDGAPPSVFAPPQVSSRYRLLYERVGGQESDYRTVFIDVARRRAVYVLDGHMQAQLRDASAYYVWNRELRRRDLGDGSEVVLVGRDDPVWSIAVTADDEWRFHVRWPAPVVRGVGARARRMAAARALVTDAGMLTPEWVWFSKSANEKAAEGELWLMRTDSARLRRVRGDAQRCRLAQVLDA